MASCNATDFVPTLSLGAVNKTDIMMHAITTAYFVIAYDIDKSTENLTIDFISGKKPRKGVIGNCYDPTGRGCIIGERERER